MNDLPKLMYNKSIPILFADDTSILFTHSNTTKFIANIHTVFEIISTWFKTVIFNKILKKTRYIHFKTRNRPSNDMKIGLDNRLIPSDLHTKFLLLTIDSQYIIMENTYRSPNK
jgi:hypothetical protein